MPKLIVLTEGFKDRSCDLKDGVTTVGRAEDNMFCIPEGSISGHHCEVIVKDGKVFVKDLDSTNGTYIDGDQISAETPLTVGMSLRLGQCELRLDDKNAFKQVMASHRGGVKLDGSAPAQAPVNPAFKKKDNKMNLYILGGGIVVVVLIVVFLLIR